MMSDLPCSRVTPNRIFSSVGTDFAGPFQLKDGRTRNRKIVKAYICIFICLSSKAIHLELAGELTAECFLGVLKRFVSRRGLCSQIYSDYATNFQGANNELVKRFKFLEDTEFKGYLQDNCIN